MLAQKKLSQKKLSVYIGIIVLMLCGTALMLYQNKKLTSPRIVTADDPTRYRSLEPAQEAALPESVPPADTAGAAPAPAKSSPTAEITIPEKNGGLDLTIFRSDKFKQLKANQPINQIQAEVGKRDPFKPN